jgi:hypothetical protein
MAKNTTSCWQRLGFRKFTHTCAIALCMLAGGMSGAPAFAQQEAVSRANKLYETIAPNLRSDMVLVPLLIKLEAAPGPFGSVGEAMLLGAETRAFPAAKAWAEKAPQKAMLEGLKKVTAESDFRKAYAWGMPYGAEAVPAEWVMEKMYVELGDPPTLAAAQLLYLPKLDLLESLVQVEATRRAAMDDPNGAIDVLTDLAFFARQMADRQLMDEALWGMRVMQRSLDRMRDIAYVDMSTAKRKLNVDKLLPQVARLDGYILLDRMKLPAANQIAGEQVLSRVYDDKGAIRPDVFAATMASMGVAGKPLRIFSEAARWQGAADAQADGATAKRILSGIYQDWTRRWAMGPFDDALNSVSAYQQFDRNKQQAVMMATPNVWQLSEWRRLNELERVGSRAALSIVGTFYSNNVLPPTPTSIRPRWMKEMEADPYNPNIQFQGKPPLEYFVPQRGRGIAIDQNAKPHELTVVTSVPGRPSVTFKVNVKGDVFVLYSFGTDQARNGAARVQNTAERVQGADYLIFPSPLSLYRQYLIDAGELQ